MEDLVFINHVRLPHLLNTLSYKNTDEEVASRSGFSVTMDLVPQESSLNSNRTLDPSVSFGPQVGSNSVVLSGWTVGQVEAGVVTTVMTPSAEQTDTRGSKRRGVRRPIQVNVKAPQGGAAYPSCPGLGRGSVWRWMSASPEFWSPSEEV